MLCLMKHEPLLLLLFLQRNKDEHVASKRRRRRRRRSRNVRGVGNEERERERKRRWASPPLEVGLLWCWPTNQHPTSPVQSARRCDARRRVFHARTRPAVTNQLWRPSPINRPPPFLIYLHIFFFFFFFSPLFIFWLHHWCSSSSSSSFSFSDPPRSFKRRSFLAFASSLTRTRKRAHTQHSLTDGSLYDYDDNKMFHLANTTIRRHDLKHKLKIPLSSL